MNDLIAQPIIQFGFLGLSCVLLVYIFYLTKQIMNANDKLMDLQEKTNVVIADNTEAVNSLMKLVADLVKLNRDNRDKLISRPCIATRENG